MASLESNYSANHRLDIVVDKVAHLNDNAAKITISVLNMYIPAFIKAATAKISLVNFMWALAHLIFNIMVLIPLILVDLTQMFLESRFFARLARRFFKLTFFASSALMFYKTALFGYYKYTAQEEAAAKEKAEMLTLGQKAFQFCKKQAFDFVKQTAIGMVVATFSLTTFIAGTIAYEAAMVYFWPDYDFGFDDADDDVDNDNLPTESFTDLVVFAPLLEEIMYRGIVLPLMKKAIHNAINYFKQPAPGNAENANAIPTAPTEEEANQADAANENTNTVVDHAANFGTAVLFAQAHSDIRKPYAFFGGLVSGELTRRYGLTAAWAEHTTNNGIAYLATRYLP